MVWTNERCRPTLTKYAKTSEPTILVNYSAGTFHDGTHVDNTNSSNQLGISTVSTYSTQHSASTYSAIPTTYPHNLVHPQRHQSFHLSHARLALHNRVQFPSQTRMRPPEPTALISTRTGKRIEITMTTRRSTGPPFPEPFVNQPSRKSWTLKDVILCHYQWQPSCTSKPTIIGFESWLTVVKFI